MRIVRILLGLINILVVAGLGLLICVAVQRTTCGALSGISLVDGICSVGFATPGDVLLALLSIPAWLFSLISGFKICFSASTESIFSVLRKMVRLWTYLLFASATAFTLAVLVSKRPEASSQSAPSIPAQPSTNALPSLSAPTPEPSAPAPVI